MSRTITHLHVYARNACSSHGVLKLGQTYFRCLLGRSGKKHLKREGDGASPIGRWKLEQLYYRADKILLPRNKLKSHTLRQRDGWCDASTSGAYNRHVKLPFKFSHEKLWRNDKAYDVVISTNHNQRPRIRGGGSAIFLHVINAGATYTEGCVALSERDLRNILARCSGHTYLVI